MLRLFLVLALLAAGAALYFGQMEIKPKIDGLNEQVASTTKERDDARTAQSKAEKASKESQAAADKAIKELSDTKTSLEAKTSEAAEQRERADKLAANLEETTGKFNNSSRELSRWEALGIKPEQIKALQESYRKTLVERDEAKIAIVQLNKELKFAVTELNSLKEPDTEIKLPASTKGRITGVGAGNDFVFIDRGRSSGIVKGGKLMVRDGSQLITKVVVVSVADDHCIANILPEWTQGGLAVKTGNEVFP